MPQQAPTDTSSPDAHTSEMLISESEDPYRQVEKFTARGRAQKETPIDLLDWSDVVRAGRARVASWIPFILCVVLPLAGSIGYFGFLASDVFISESRFVVRTPQKAPQSGLLGSLLQVNGFQRAQDDSFSVHDFMLSRDALAALDSKLGLKSSFSDATLDPLSRFPGPFIDDSFESLYKHYKKHVTVNYDITSSITTVTVRAYTAQDAFGMNSALLQMSEDLVNRINDRGRGDLIRFATADVTEAEAKAKSAAFALASYRNRRSVFDPERQSTLQLQQITKIQDELISTKLQLAQLRSLAPSNPQVPTIERRVRGLEVEMANEMSKVAGGGNSFTDKAGEFERLQLERTFADRQVASALSNLEAARSEARRQQLYLERVVQPNLPDTAIEPRRLRAIIATFVVGLLSWGVLTMLMAGVREHKA